MTDNSGKEIVLKRVLYIHYPIQFQGGQKQVRALLNSSSKVNTMNLAYIKNLGFYIRKTNVGAQKIYGSALQTFEIVITDFQVEDKGDRPRFFQEIILVAKTKFKVMLRMSFLEISNVNVAFGEGSLMWKFYIINKALPTTKQVQLVDPKELVIVALDADSKTFVVYVTIREQEKLHMHFERQTQIESKADIDIKGQSGAQVKALLFDKSPPRFWRNIPTTATSSQ